jgi:hypothetical protein
MKRAKTTKIEHAASGEPFPAKNNAGNQYLRTSIGMLDNNETGTRYQRKSHGDQRAKTTRWDTR